MNDEALALAVETTALAYHTAYTSKETTTVDVFDRWQAMMDACAALKAARAVDPVETALARLDGPGVTEAWREPK